MILRNLLTMYLPYNQVDKLLQRIKLQEAGEMEAPPISLPDWIDEDAEDGGFNFDDALSAEGKPLTDEELASFFAGVWQSKPISLNQL